MSNAKIKFSDSEADFTISPCTLIVNTLILSSTVSDERIHNGC